MAVDGSLEFAQLGAKEQKAEPRSFFAITFDEYISPIQEGFFETQAEDNSWREQLNENYQAKYLNRLGRYAKTTPQFVLSLGVGYRPSRLDQPPETLKRLVLALVNINSPYLNNNNLPGTEELVLKAVLEARGATRYNKEIWSDLSSSQTIMRDYRLSEETKANLTRTLQRMDKAADFFLMSMTAFGRPQEALEFLRETGTLNKITYDGLSGVSSIAHYLPTDQRRATLNVVLELINQNRNVLSRNTNFNDVSSLEKRISKSLAKIEKAEQQKNKEQWKEWYKRQKLEFFGGQRVEDMISLEWDWSDDQDDVLAQIQKKAQTRSEAEAAGYILAELGRRIIISDRGDGPVDVSRGSIFRWLKGFDASDLVKRRSVEEYITKVVDKDMMAGDYILAPSDLVVWFEHFDELLNHVSEDTVRKERLVNIGRGLREAIGFLRVISKNNEARQLVGKALFNDAQTPILSEESLKAFEERLNKVFGNDRQEAQGNLQEEVEEVSSVIENDVPRYRDKLVLQEKGKISSRVEGRFSELDTEIATKLKGIKRSMESQLTTKKSTLLSLEADLQRTREAPVRGRFRNRGALLTEKKKKQKIADLEKRIKQKKQEVQELEERTQSLQTIAEFIYSSDEDKYLELKELIDKRRGIREWQEKFKEDETN